MGQANDIQFIFIFEAVQTVALFVFITIYIFRNRELGHKIKNLEKSVDQFEKQSEYNHQFMKHHFDVTDQTILDLRTDKAILTKENQKLTGKLENTKKKMDKISKGSSKS